MMFSFLYDAKRGRAVMLTAMCFIWLLILGAFKYYGYEETWRLWKVPTEMPPFLDFRMIPASAESFQNGFEPTIKNPFDPYKRPFNYPFVWRLFFYSSISQDDTIWISIVMIALFFVAVLLFPDRLTGFDIPTMLALVFSPAFMLLYERGNNDLIVIVICAVVVISSSRSVYIPPVLVLLASVLKFYPLFGISVLLKESRSMFIKLTSGVTVFFGIYVYITSKSFAKSWEQTPRGDEISYGANVFFLRYRQLFSESLDVSVESPLLKFGPVVLALGLMIVGVLIGITGNKSLASFSPGNLAAFRMGASIYVGTFMLGNNWDYRLAFLIFAIPQLMEWSRSTGFNRFRLVSIFLLVLIFMSCWHFMVWFAPSLAQSKESVFILDECANWLMLAGFGYLLAGSAPGWVRDMFWFLTPKNKAVLDT